MGLRFKLFLPIFFAYIALVAVMHFYWAPNVLERERGLALLEEYEVLNAMSPGLVRPLLSGDLAALHANLDYHREANLLHWKSIKLTKPDGKRIYPLKLEEVNLSESLIFLEFPVEWDGENLANLSLVMDWGFRRDEVVEWINNAELLAMLVFALVVLVTALWQSRLICRPIVALEYAATQIAAGNFSIALASTGNDEIDKLTQAFITMRDSLSGAQDDLKHALRKVSENEARLQAILNAVVDAIIVINKNGVIVSINPATEKMFGYTSAEAVGKNISFFLPKEDRASHDMNVSMSKLKEGSMTLQRGGLFGLRKSGEEFPVEVSISPVLSNESGYIVGVVRDISLQKQTELDLLQAKEESEKANMAKSEFLSHMSHELRTPLNAVLGFSQLLEMSLEDEDNKDNLSEIIHAGQHLLSLINEVLDLSRIEAGKVDLFIESVVLNDVLSDSFALIGAIASDAEVELIDHISTQSDFNVRVDAGRLKQVLLNLMSNAVKYNRQGGSVTLSYQEVGDDQLRINVTDTGHGLTALQQEKIFRPFERAGASKSNIEGTGVGLVITKHLIGMMGGEIGFDSEHGQGSCFWFEVVLDTERAAKVKDTNSDDDEIKIQRPSRTILYIEDNPTSLRLVTNLIRERTPYRLLAAPDANIGLELVWSHRPDLILMDINLPGMSGYDAMAKLQENEATRRIPVIALSANAMEKDKKMGEKAGFCAYITKPLDVAELIREIDKAVGV